METKNKINIYTCDTCGGEIVTINRNDGVTPAFVACHAQGNMDEDARPCDGTMGSAWYRCDQNQKPNFEWYRPTGKEIKKLDAATREHVKLGGLVLRKIVSNDIRRFRLFLKDIAAGAVDIEYENGDSMQADAKAFLDRLDQLAALEVALGKNKI
jgi:hypothetical protein